MTRKIYRVHGTLWTQEELTWAEDQELRPILAKLSGKFAFDKVSLQDVIDTVFDGETVEAFMRIVLKPYAPTPFHRAYNAIVARAQRIDRDEIVKLMRNSQLAEVLADFFTLNTSWIGSWPMLRSILDSTSPRATPQ